MPKTVWVLGAGFARSLGAPLLADLFRQEDPIDALAYFPEDGYPGLVRDMTAAQITFNWGRDIEHLWEDAEQFLSFVDDAYSSTPVKRKRLDQLAGRARRLLVPGNQYSSNNGQSAETMIHDLQRASRRALAAETSRFMMTSRDGELWFPYREWAAGLQAENDTIVTFNYDVLLDELGKEAPFTIPLPHKDPELGKIPVLKLHGSANWLLDGATCVRLRDYEALARHSGPYPAIAAPGRSKSPDGEPPFPHLWTLAEAALTKAQRVCFVGYRFPPTDALAKVRLGRALADDNGPRVRRIDVVLGPDTGSNDSRRLSTLLEAARGPRYFVRGDDRTGFYRVRAVHQPLWAEDFLTTHADLARDQSWDQ